MDKNKTTISGSLFPLMVSLNNHSVIKYLYSLRR